MSPDIRVRYGKINNQAKNTLVTVRDGDVIYFGISRCRLNADKMNKVEGKKLATVRANVALHGSTNLTLQEGTLFVHKSNMFGKVHHSEIKKLLEYFDTIDSRLLPDYLKGSII